MQLSTALKKADLTIKHGKLNAVSLNDSHITSKDATITIHSGIFLKIDSDGSEMILNNMQNLDLNSNKDHIDILKSAGISGTIKHSKIFLKNLGGEATLRLHYGELRILKHLTNSPNINIDQKEAEVYINISETDFMFSAKLEQGVLRIPKKMNNIESEMIKRREKIRRINASYGNRKGKISCTVYKGVIILKEL